MGLVCMTNKTADTINVVVPKSSRYGFYNHFEYKFYVIDKLRAAGIPINPLTGEVTKGELLMWEDQPNHCFNYMWGE